MKNLSSYFNTAKNVITANSPVLLVGAGLTGVVSVAVLSARAGYKARGVVDAERMKRVASPEPPFDTFLDYYQTFDEQTPELDLKEKALLTWPLFVIPAATAVGTGASIIGVHVIHTKRYAALSALYAIGMDKLDEVKQNAEELLGPKKSQELNNRIAQANVDRDPVQDHEVIILEGGTTLMHDDLSGRWFMGSHAIVEKAVGEINLMLAENGDASLNDFYDFVGLKPIPLGQNVGWSGPRISPQFGSANTADGRSAVSYWFLEAPKENLGLPR